MWLGTYLEEGMVETIVADHGNSCCGQVERDLTKHDTPVDELHVSRTQLKEEGKQHMNLDFNRKSHAFFPYM